MSIGVNIELNVDAIAKLEAAVLKAADMAIDATVTDLKNSGTMPFDTGDMQNNQTFTIPARDYDGEIVASINVGSPQARYLYYGKAMAYPKGEDGKPQVGGSKTLTGKTLNFQKGKNANAGPFWYDPYLNGDKKDLTKENFEKFYKKEAGV